MRISRVIPVLVLMVTALVVGSVPSGADTPAVKNPYTCTGGNIPAGTYSKVTVTGSCYMPAGTIDVTGNIAVKAGALLDASTAGDPVGSPLLPADLSVAGNITVGSGGVLLLGCSPFLTCPSAVTFDQVGGTVSATDPLGVLIHSASIGGSLDVAGGGGGGGTCTTQPPLWLSDPALANGEGPGTPVPVYTDIEDVSVGGDLDVVGMQSCWLGALRDQVGGSMTVSGNTMADPDAMELGSNQVTQSMTCQADSPRVQYGDSGAAPDIVGGAAVGQCSFSQVSANNGGAKAIGVLEHLTVRASSLATYSGTLTTTKTLTDPLGTTTSGVTVLEQESKAVLAGTGVTGAFTQKVLIDSASDGSDQFYAVDAGPMSFNGTSGAVQILAVGSTTAAGLTTGTFQVISGGTGNGSLATLAGWGTFSSAGQPAGALALVEHLEIS